MNSKKSFTLVILLTTALMQFQFQTSKSHYEGTYIDSLGLGTIVLLIKYDKVAGAYSGAMINNLTKNTYSLDIKYLEEDSMGGILTSVNGHQKDITGKFHNDFIEISLQNTIFRQLDIDFKNDLTEKYTLKKFRNKSIYDSNEFDKSRGIDKNLVGHWISIDAKHQSRGEYTYDYFLDGTCTFSSPDNRMLSREDREFFRKMATLRWFTHQNLITEYYELHYASSLGSVPRTNFYKIDGDTLIVKTKFGVASKFIREKQ